MGEMSVMGRMGDLRVTWDRTRAEEVEAARQQFEQLRKKGYLAFSVRVKDGEKGEQIFKFDAEAERIILAPPMRGGS